MTQPEYLMSEGEAEAVLASLMSRQPVIAPTMGYGTPNPPVYTEQDEQRRLNEIEAAEARYAAEMLERRQQGRPTDPAEILAGVGPYSDPREDVRAINRTGVVARLFDDEDPYTTLWHADGRSSRVPKNAINRYLKKRDHVTGQRVFFRVPPPMVQVPTFTIPCMVQPCRKKFPNEIQQLAHAEVYHPQEFNWMKQQKQLNIESRSEQEQLEIRKERRMMQAMLMAVVMENPSMAKVIEQLGINLGE